MQLLKRLVVGIMPKPLLMWGKKFYYAKVVPEFNEPDVRPISRFVKPGDTVFDLGANLGWYTCVLSRLVGPKGKVYAVEPIPETFEVLSFVVEKLGLQNVTLCNCAVSDQVGSGVMKLPLHDYGGTNFYMAHLVTGQGEEASPDLVEVPLQSLDGLLAGQVPESVSFIKCDVEGHEVGVLKGAKSFFQKAKPAMLIEVSGTAEVQDDPNNEFYSILCGYGYEAYWYDGGHLRKRTKGHWSVNYFFLQPSHLGKASDIVASNNP